MLVLSIDAGWSSGWEKDVRDPMFYDVGEILGEVASAVILPRYQALKEGEIHEKSAGDLVTIADLEAERAISPRLAALLPGSRVVGEEACAANPALLHGLEEG